MQKRARITSKRQITRPLEIRQALGVQAGDRVLFESDGEEVRMRPVRTQSPFGKYRGIGNPGIASGRKGVTRWLRKLRGQ
jgi:AbrB family looped-hinge helix DNA binding protein